MSNICWVVYSDDATPMGIEIDFWVKEGAYTEYNSYCSQYPNAEFVLYCVSDKDEPNEKWLELERRSPEPPANSCTTCGGTGEIDESLGGIATSGIVPCPDCQSR